MIDAYVVFRYNRINRTYLFDIDFWHMADPKAQNPVAVHVIPPVVKEPSEWEVLYAVDAFRIGNVCFHSRFPMRARTHFLSSSRDSW
jgi:hypothetical protein